MVASFSVDRDVLMNLKIKKCIAIAHSYHPISDWVFFYAAETSLFFLFSSLYCVQSTALRLNYTFTTIEW